MEGQVTARFSFRQYAFQCSKPPQGLTFLAMRRCNTRRRPHRRTNRRPKPTIPAPSGSRSLRTALSQPFPHGSTAGSSIGTTRSATGPATWSRTISATSSSFEPPPPGTTNWRTATAPWSTWPLGSSRPRAPGELRKSRSISQATNSPPTTLNYPWPWPWPWPWWPDS